MHPIHVTVRVSNVTGKGKPLFADFVLDTSAIHSTVPRSQLRAAGVKVTGKSIDILPNGKALKREYGFARLKILGDDTIIRVDFGPDRAAPILGWLALLSIGIIVDRKTHDLRRLPALPLK